MGVDRPFRLKARGIDHAAWAADVIHQGLVGLEALAVETSRGYTVGDAPTIADACLIPQLYNANGFGLDVSSGGDYPTLAAVAALASSCRLTNKQPQMCNQMLTHKREIIVLFKLHQLHRPTSLNLLFMRVNGLLPCVPASPA